MDTHTLNEFDRMLAARGRELMRSLAERNQIAIERSADEIDNALLAAERESSAQVLAQDMQLLRQVEAALNRLRNGTYGICADCGEAIGSKRLKALPWAARCTSCQAAREQDGALRPARARAA